MYPLYGSLGKIRCSKPNVVLKSKDWKRIQRIYFASIFCQYASVCHLRASAVHFHVIYNVLVILMF